MSKDSLLKQINNHEILHDFITHLSDFKEAIDFKINFGDLDQIDFDYWMKQFNTVNRLKKYVEENS